MTDEEDRFSLKEFLLDWREWTAVTVQVGIYLGGVFGIMTLTALVLGISPLAWTVSKLSTYIFFDGLMTGLVALMFLRLGEKSTRRIRAMREQHE